MKRIVSFLLSVALLLSLLPAAGTAVEQDDYTEETAEVFSESDLQLEEKPSVESAFSVPVESIHISSTNTIVAIGNTLALSASVLPENADNKAITWLSSNESVLTVSQEGIVTAVSAGIAFVYANAIDGSGVTGCVELTVEDNNPDPISDTILVEEISISAERTVISVGDTLTLSAYVFPENAENTSVSWGVSDDSILTVDNNGAVTAISVGTSLVFACAQDGSDIRTSIELTVVSNGEDRVPAGNSWVDVFFECNPSELSLCVYSESGDLVLPEDGRRYRLAIGNYTYTAELEGYIGKTGIPFVVEESISSFPVELTEDENSIFSASTSTAAVIASGSCGNDVIWSLDSEGILTICRPEIPSETGTGKMNGFLLSSAPWYKYRSAITAIDIGNGVTSVGYYAFINCENVTSVSIPASVTSIGYSAFENCSSLSSVVIPGNLETVEMFCFSGCSSLKNVVLPGSVTSIKDRAFYGCAQLTEIIIPERTTSIGSRAFAGCRALTGVVIPEGVTQIEEWCFKTCTSLSFVTIPGSVKKIGEQAFCNCTSLPAISIPGSVTSIGNGAFDNCSSLEKVYIDDLSSWCGITFADSSSNPLGNGASLYVDSRLVTQLRIPDGIDRVLPYAFYNCTDLISVEIPAGVTQIGEYAFFQCDNVVSLNISFGVTDIGTGAFQNCTSLTSVNIPSSVSSIEERVFSGCTGLTSVHIPSSVTQIGNYAFYNCTGLTCVCIDDLSSWCSVDFSEYYSNPLYYGGGLYINDEVITELVIPGDVEKIQAYAFLNCSGLTSVTIPESVTSIGQDAFSGCRSVANVCIDNLAAWCEITFESGSSNPLCNGAALYVNGEPVTELVIPTGTTRIKDFSFCGCGGLTSVLIPEGVTGIGREAFSGCGALTAVAIPGGVEIIDEKAFYKCTGLIALEIPEGVKEIGASAFYGCSSLSAVTVPASMEKFGEKAFYLCKKIKQVSITDLCAWCSIEFTDSDSNPLSNAGKLLLDEEITDLVLPSNVTSIGNYAFFGFCGLQSVVISSGTTSIGKYAFGKCVNMTSVEIPDSVAFMGEYAFDECVKLSSVTIPKGISEISNYLFWKCRGLTSVTIPNSVNSIRHGAFLLCDSLEDVFYSGSADEWSAISIESGNDLLASVTIHYHYGKDPFPITVKTSPEGRTVRVTNQNNEPITAAYYGETVIVTCFDDAEYEVDYVTAPNAKDLIPVFSNEGQAFSFTMPDCEVEIEAVYRERITGYTYKITFNKNARNATGTMSTISGNTLSGGTLPPNSFKYSRKAFAGWNTEPDGTGRSFRDGEPIDEIIREDNCTLTLYAQWRDIRYSIEFQADGIPVGRVELNYGEKYKLEDFGTHKYGYHVGSWKNTSNSKNYSLGTSVSNLTTKDGAVIVFRANWAANSFRIVYDGNGSSAVRLKPLKITYNKKFTLASGSYKYTHEGFQYELKGWSLTPLEPCIDYTFDYVKGKGFTAAECGELTKAWSNGAEKRLYAVWGPVEYKINYRNVPSGAVNGNPAQYNSVRGVDSFSNLDAPGYVFHGWYSDSRYKVPISGIPGGQTGTKTVYAKVSPISYSITYNLNGGRNSGKNPSSYNISQKTTLYSPSRTGYTFGGWYLGDTKVAALSKGTFYGGDIVLTAKWNPIAYTVKYYANGGTFAEGTVTTQRVFYDETIALPTRSAISKNGYTLTGWNTRADCSGASYWLSTANLSSKPSTIKLYAMWEYPVVLHGCVEGAMDNELSLYFNQSRRLTNEGFSRPGYTFKGWAASAENAAKGLVKYANNKTVKNLAPGTQLWAVWSANSVKITFNMNDGAKYPAKKTMTLKSGANLPAELFSRNELRIVEWNTSKDGAGTAYKPDEPVANIAKKSSSSMTLYAIWGTREGYEISFDANGGTGNMDTVILQSGNTIPECSFTAPSGKVFIGWKVNNEGELISDKAQVEATGDNNGSVLKVVLYAQWRRNFLDGCTADSFKAGCEELVELFLEYSQSINKDATKPYFTTTGKSCGRGSHLGCDSCKMSNVLDKMVDMGFISHDHAKNIMTKFGEASTCQAFHNVARYYLFGGESMIGIDPDKIAVLTNDSEKWNVNGVKELFTEYAKVGDRVRLDPNHPMLITEKTEDGIMILDNNSTIGEAESSVIRIHKMTWEMFLGLTKIEIYRYPEKCTSRYTDIKDN